VKNIMNKFITTDKLEKLAKALNNRINISAEELTELINDVKEMLGGRSLVYVTQAEYEALSEDEKSSESIMYVITDMEQIHHTHENADFLASLTEGNVHADSVNGYKIWVGTTEELAAIEEKDPFTVYFEIGDEDEENEEEVVDTIEVVEVEIVNGILTLTEDKYQKCVNMLNDTELVFPSVSTFTELHLYFNADDELNLVFPECKWRVEPNIEAGKSYEIVAVYNTMEWLVNCIVYS
jgi:hypothetical protein